MPLTTAARKLHSVCRRQTKNQDHHDLQAGDNLPVWRPWTYVRSNILLMTRKWRYYNYRAQWYTDGYCRKCGQSSWTVSATSHSSRSMHWRDMFNKKDLNKRSKQVTSKGQICRSSKGTLLWLDDLDSAIEKIFRMLNNLARAVFRAMKSG